MACRILILLFTMLYSFQSMAQISFDSIVSGKTDLKKVTSSLEEICHIPQSGWENTGSQEFQPNREKLTIIHVGSMHRTADFENMRNLSILQQNYPQIRILLIDHHQNLHFTNRKELEDLLFRHDIYLPLFRGELKDKSQCLEPESESTTFILTPDKRILDIRSGFLDVEKLGNDIFELQGILLDVYKSDKTPYFNNSPRRFEKQLYWPSLSGVEVLESLNLLGFADYMRNQIFLSSTSGEIVERIGSGRPGFADGDFQNARFNGPRGMAFHSDSNALYIADTRNHRIRKVNPETMRVTTVLGNGSFDESPTSKVIGTHGSICLPTALHFDGDMLYFTTSQGVYQMDVRTGVAELIAVANNLSGVTVDGNGIIYCSSTSGSKIYEIYGSDLTRVAGKISGHYDGKKEEILFSGPGGIEISGREMFIADTYNNSLRSLQYRRRKSETRTSNLEQKGQKLSIKHPLDLAVSGEWVYITSSGNGTIWVYDQLADERNSLMLTMSKNTFPPVESKIIDLREGETIEIGKGQNEIHFQFELDSKLALSKSFPSSANVSPSQSIEVIDSDLSDMELVLTYQVEEDRPPGPIVIDLYLTVENDKTPEVKYQWNISFIYDVEIDSNSATTEKAISITTPVKETR